MGGWARAVVLLAGGAIGQAGPSRRGRPAPRPARGWGGWLADPRSAVLIVLGSVLLIGGGRKLFKGWRSRGAVARLGEMNVSVEAIDEAAAHGRAGLFDLFRILGTAETETLRHAAGHALTVLWAQDQLIAEEEQAVVRRGYSVNWHARRRYPRTLRSPIPIAVSYGLPFLREDGAGIKSANLEWSHRILGAERAGLEAFTPWTPGPGRAAFTINPGDFAGNGPHRIEIQARVRTVGLTSSWEIALPHIPFSFELDPILQPEALLSLADASCEERMARAVRLEPASPGDGAMSQYLDLNDEMALRDPPSLVVTTPLPSDLAHTVEVELEGLPGRFAAGEIVLSGQGTGRAEAESSRRFPLGPPAPLPPDSIDRPGPRRMRVILSADADKGWADPEIRSIWPGTIVTEWVEVRVVRR
jgi:hypothetical protein